MKKVYFYLPIQTAVCIGGLPIGLMVNKKTLALGVYPRVSLAEARELRDTARDKIARGFDPAQTSKDTAELFSNICEEWFQKKKPTWSESNAKKLRSRLNNDIIPWLGNKKIKDITARDAL